jgi:hypothetical protein
MFKNLNNMVKLSTKTLRMWIVVVVIEIIFSKSQKIESLT